MIVVKRDMWEIFDEVDFFIITTNSFMKHNGALVMGTGIARECRDKYTGIDFKMADAIRSKGDDPHAYGLILGKKIGMFQVKTHYKNKASLDLIALSTSMLKEEADANPDKVYALNFPGIGAGRLNYEEVLPVIAVLPDNVHVFVKP